MRIAADPLPRRIARRAKGLNPLWVAEFLLLVILAVQSARLVWAIVTPLGPVGDWVPAVPKLEVRQDAAVRFDPFFRLQRDAGPVVVSDLDLKLHGVREDRATGRGAAIIGLPGGEQRSFATGDEILPGARLAHVGFDHVTIDRGGVAEQLYLDQSVGTSPESGERE